MIRRIAETLVIAGALTLVASDARAAQQLTCQQILALSRFAGGKMSADGLAQQLHTDAGTVHDCLDGKKVSDAKLGQAPAPATK